MSPYSYRIDDLRHQSLTEQRASPTTLTSFFDISHKKHHDLQAPRRFLKNACSSSLDSFCNRPPFTAIR